MYLLHAATALNRQMKVLLSMVRPWTVRPGTAARLLNRIAFRGSVRRNESAIHILQPGT
jgi:hypothetical protein